jgi:hypothetical protein
VTEVKIDIDALQELVTALGSAQPKITGASGEIRGKLESVGLSTTSVAQLTWGGTVDAWITTWLRDLNRRLSLARMIQASTPGLTVVSFDDSVLATTSDAEVKKQVSALLDKMKVGDQDYDPRNVDPEVLRILEQNALDPYFAAELARRLGPEALDRYLKVVNRGLSAPAMIDKEPAQAKADYVNLLNSLGLTLGLASQGTGDVKVPGMGMAWANFIEKSALGHSGAANRLSLVIARGQWSDQFLIEVYQGVRRADGTGGAATWAVAPPENAFDPDPGIPGFYTENDPLRGIFTALQSNPRAMAKLFTGGEQKTITVDGKQVEVNAELYTLMRDRQWDSAGVIPESKSAIAAFSEALRRTIGSPPQEGETAYQLLLGRDVTNLGAFMEAEVKAAQEKAGPVWKQIAHTVLDLAGMIPVIGEPVDGVNGLWYYADGDIVNGSLSMGSMIPFVGWGATGGKWTRRVLTADELATLNDLAKVEERTRVFAKDGRLLDLTADLANPNTYRFEGFLSKTELILWSGERSFMRRVLAGNRFNLYAAPKYQFAEIHMAQRGRGGGRLRLDSYTPGVAIVSRKLTQFSQISEKTAFKYLDEFLTKYPVGAKLADTPRNQKLGIAGDTLDGQMYLEVPPQIGGKIDQRILDYASKNHIIIRDVNGVPYNALP